MRRALPLLALLAFPLAGCAGAAIAGAADLASVTVFGKDAVDIGVSAITGKDCSLVRLDRGKSYCAPREDLAAAVPYCTRTLGAVECWQDPQDFSASARPIAEQPAPAKDQARAAAARWPKSLNVAD